MSHDLRAPEQLDLPHTRAALAAYDLWDATAWAAVMSSPDPTCEHVMAVASKQEEMGWAVGHAFWLDTRDRNSQATCEGCVRPWDPWLRDLISRSQVQMSGPVA